MYAHNLAKFDGHRMTALRGEADRKVTPVMKNPTTVLEIRVEEKKVVGVKVAPKDQLKLVFRDSNRVCPGSRDKLAKTFNCSYKKGVFPYKFVTGETLGYVGSKPAYSYYNCGDEEYNRIPAEG